MRKRLITKRMALWLGAGLCAVILAGCGSDGTKAGTGTSASNIPQSAETLAADEQAPDGAQKPVKAQESTEAENPEATAFLLPEGPEESDVVVEPVEGIPDDFIRGMDASSVLAEENSGVIYYNYEGEEQDVFMTLAQSGVNYIRLRVWNDPYDENGNGYGGGNNDVAAAVELGKRATRYGMKVCIDFHYSDFWADPKRQHAPKAWEGMSAEEKCDALYEFTKESLTEILDAGVDVGMVQVGNEINNGMSGETDPSAVMALLRAGSRAVREISEAYGKDIRIAVHYTNIEQSDEIDRIASRLSNYGLDYDIFALSYYPFWDGTTENMQAVVRSLREKYGKEVMIAETSYCYTAEDGDGSGNSFDGIDGLVEGYAATVQGQASMIRDICAAANEAGALGVFYWEGAWIPVGSAEEDNSSVWEEFGSGWASSYAGDYDPEDAGLYYGGCSWDNQAMFDFEGHPLASLNVFKYLKFGSTAPLAVDHIPEIAVSCDVGGEFELPETVLAVYNDRSSEERAVTWDAAQLAAVDTGVGGVYEITGKLEDGASVVCHVEVKMTNYVQNPSFEDTDTSMWKVAYAGSSNPTDFQVKVDDAYSGDVAFHFWSESDMEFSIEQEFADLEPGTYQLSAYAQGGDLSSDSVMELYAAANGEEQTATFMMTTYADWKNPTISEIKVVDGTLTIGVRMKCNAKSWGTVDDFALYRISD